MIKYVIMFSYIYYSLNYVQKNLLYLLIEIYMYFF